MPFLPTLKQKVREKANHRCCICHEVFVDVHHIKPESENGPNNEENAAPLCAGCHDKYGNNPDKRKQIIEMRDEWYKQCERTRNAADNVSQELKQTLGDSIKNILEGLNNTNFDDPIKLKTEIAHLRTKLTYMESSLSSLLTDLNRLHQEQIMEDIWKLWPDGSSNPVDLEARNILNKATNNTYIFTMDWIERFVYYLLVMSGSRVDSYDFCNYASNEFARIFPNPRKPAWGTMVLSALGELRLKGFIQSPSNFTPGTEIIVITPYPYSFVSNTPT